MTNATQPVLAPRPPAARSLEALAELGLTPLESEIYAFLLNAPAATGYRIAQAIGKPVGNIYKAIEALESKGAVLTSDDGGNRTARAVAVEEWLRLRTRAFEAACAEATASLAIPAASDAEGEVDDGLYRLHTLEQALERTRTVIAEAQRVLIATIAPALVADVAAELSAATHRGVAVAVKTFAPCEIPGAEIVVDPRGGAALEGAPGDWLILNSDGRECVHALVHPETRELLTATWSANPLLAWSHYSGIASDVLLAALRRSIASGASTAMLGAELARLEHLEIPDSSGKTLLVRRHRAPSGRGRRGRRSG